ncbi:MAG: hypothetical protein ABF727_14510 [Gluconobacter oxydans]
MKLMIREYQASLRERGELDAILPDLLTEMGYRIFSRPSVSNSWPVCYACKVRRTQYGNQERSRIAQELSHYITAYYESFFYD